MHGKHARTSNDRGLMSIVCLLPPSQLPQPRRIGTVHPCLMLGNREIIAWVHAGTPDMCVPCCAPRRKNARRGMVLRGSGSLVTSYMLDSPSKCHANSNHAHHGTCKMHTIPIFTPLRSTFQPSHRHHILIIDNASSFHLPSQ